jgi:hypothetical protein
MLRNYKEEIRAYYRYLLFVSPDEPDSKNECICTLGYRAGLRPKRDFLGYVKTSLIANGIGLAGLGLSEAYTIFKYIVSFHNKELQRSENNPFVQVTTKLLTFDEWLATGDVPSGETED